MPKKTAAPANTLATADTIAQLKKDIEKELGGSLYYGSDETLRTRWLPLGIPQFDHILGGGLPFDRMVELIGEFSSGKTTLALMAIKAAQAQNLVTAFVDVERTWEPVWATAIGADPSKVLVARPRTGEEAFNNAIALVRAQVGVLVVDSLAAMVPSARSDKEVEEMFNTSIMGKRAQLINDGLSTLSAENRGTLVIVINQLREGIGVIYGNPEQLPGGKGQRFIATQIIRVKRGAWIEEGTGKEKRRVGYKMRIKAEKNKVGEPFGEAEAPFYFTGEFDELAGLVDLCLELDIIHAVTPNYYIGWNEAEGLYDKKIYGRKNLMDAVREDAELQQRLRDATADIEEVEI